MNYYPPSPQDIRDFAATAQAAAIAHENPWAVQLPGQTFLGHGTPGRPITLHVQRVPLIVNPTPIDQLKRGQ